LCCGEILSGDALLQAQVVIILIVAITPHKEEVPSWIGKDKYRLISAAQRCDAVRWKRQQLLALLGRPGDDSPKPGGRQRAFTLARESFTRSQNSGSRQEYYRLRHAGG
jgi:hypothetical protein